jgi:hypothetical protein
MKTASHFAAFQMREWITVTAGAGATRCSLIALVIGAVPDELVLTLRDEPADPELLVPGAIVGVRRDRGNTVHAQVIAYETGEHPIVVVGMLAAPPPRHDQRAAHRTPVTMRETTLVVRAHRRTASTKVRILDLSTGGARILTRRPGECAASMSLRHHGLLNWFGGVDEGANSQ